MTSAGEEQEVETGSRVLIRDTATGRFLPGQSGNPNGRPKKGNTIAERFQRLAPATNSRIAATMVKQAIAGNDKQQRLIMEYQSGLPVRASEITLGASEELLSAIAAQNAMRRQLLGEVIEGEYTATEAQRDG